MAVICVKPLSLFFFPLLDVLHQLHGVDILLDALGHFLRSLHGKYDGLWAVHDVATGKDTTACSHAKGTFLYLDIAFLVDLDAICGRHNAVGRARADGQENAVKGLFAVTIVGVYGHAAQSAGLTGNKFRDAGLTLDFHQNFTPSLTASSYSLCMAGISSCVRR